MIHGVSGGLRCLSGISSARPVPLGGFGLKRHPSGPPWKIVREDVARASHQSGGHGEETQKIMEQGEGRGANCSAMRADGTVSASLHSSANLLFRSILRYSTSVRHSPPLLLARRIALLVGLGVAYDVRLLPWQRSCRCCDLQPELSANLHPHLPARNRPQGSAVGTRG